MVCAIEIFEKPQLKDPILVEGLPGIGFVANISALHLIKELNAKLFARIVSASFQDISITADAGAARSPLNELYYVKRENCDHDLIIWYGNTQALTTFGQYELCGKVLDIVKDLGCHFVISIGGFKKKEVKQIPIVYCAATDKETIKTVLDLGTKLMVGHIFGLAGLLIGMGRLRDIVGFSLLVETQGMYPDSNAARYALTVLSKYLNLTVGFADIEKTADTTKRLLEDFGIIRKISEEKKNEEQQMRWFI
ncbi:PAC2 family protein [Candidatus Bathyarchaeota archaeon]|nr:PAC2 family protein [Candidatus Bathyarchaeota archaeon]